MRGTLLLEDGASFEGEVFGRGSPHGREVVCANGVGWPELLGSPSYAGQIVACVAGPGGLPESPALERCFPSGWVLNGVDPARLHEYAWRWNIAGLAGVNTAALSAHLKSSGPLAGAIVAEGPRGTLPARKLAGAAGDPHPQDVLPRDVSTDRPYRIYGGGSRVVVYDFGLTGDLLLALTTLDCQVTVVPWDYPAENVLEMFPDAVVLSTGPGNPAACDSLITGVRPLIGRLPVLGCGLGHQLLARALGGRTGAMWCGHRGCGYMVRDLDGGAIQDSTQSHGFCVLGVPPGARVTHVAVSDGTIEGLDYPELRAFSVQFHLRPASADALSSAVWRRLLGPVDGYALTT